MGSYSIRYSDPPDGGPDQTCCEMTCNGCQPTFSQSASLVPGDLIRWHVFEDLIDDVNFEVHPVEGGCLPVYDKPPIKGVKGRTKYMQVRLPEDSKGGTFGFVIMVGRKRLCEGFVIVDSVRRKRTKAKPRKK